MLSDTTLNSMKKLSDQWAACSAFFLGPSPFPDLDAFLPHSGSSTTQTSMSPSSLVQRSWGSFPKSCMDDARRFWIGHCVQKRSRCTRPPCCVLLRTALLGDRDPRMSRRSAPRESLERDKVFHFFVIFTTRPASPRTAANDVHTVCSTTSPHASTSRRRRSTCASGNNVEASDVNLEQITDTLRESSLFCVPSRRPTFHPPRGPAGTSSCRFRGTDPWRLILQMLTTSTHTPKP